MGSECWRPTGILLQATGLALALPTRIARECDVRRVGGWHTLWRGKTCLQLLRGVMVYVWPLSIVGRLFYRLRWSPPLYGVINRRSRRVFRSIPQVLEPHGVEAVCALETGGFFAPPSELWRRIRRCSGIWLEMPG